MMTTTCVCTTVLSAAFVLQVDDATTLHATSQALHVHWCVDMEYSGVDSLGHNINDPVESFYGHVQPPD